MTDPEKNNNITSASFSLDEAIIEEVLFLARIGIELLSSPSIDGQLQLQFEQGYIWYYLKIAVSPSADADISKAEPTLAALCRGSCRTQEEWERFSGTLSVLDPNMAEADHHLSIPAGQEQHYQAVIFDQLKAHYPNLKSPYFPSTKCEIVQ